MGGSDGQTLLLTGGSGYVASVILQKFCKKYKADSLNTKLPGMEKISRIVLVDKFASSINEDDFTVPVQSFQGDITDLDFLSKVFAGADVVYHLASYGMSGREQLHNEMIWKVNVEGTKNVIEACRQNNVKSLIFTSTFNVVFGGQRIEDGDETLPYFDSTERSWDNYGNSKAVAEKLVLQVYNTLTANGTTTISTCVLRLAGIYGPRERRHIPRVVKAMKQGMFLFTYGDNPIVEFVHVENVVQALVQAQYSLTHSNSVAAGKAYFISDGKPVNNFEFFRPLTEALDVPFPKISVPMWLVYFIAYIIEMVYGLVHNLYDFQPLLCRAEVYKTGQTHYFSIEKARKDLNYEPQFQNDMHTVSEEYKTPPTNSMRKHGTSCSSIFISILLGILIFSLIMSLLPTAG